MIKINKGDGKMTIETLNMENMIKEIHAKTGATGKKLTCYVLLMSAALAKIADDKESEEYFKSRYDGITILTRETE